MKKSIITGVSRDEDYLEIRFQKDTQTFVLMEKVLQEFGVEFPFEYEIADWKQERLEESLERFTDSVSNFDELPVLVFFGYKKIILISKCKSEINQKIIEKVLESAEFIEPKVDDE